MKIFILCLLVAAVHWESIDGEDDFTTIDFDGDGVFKQNEMKTFFNQRDTNADGSISLLEYMTNLPSLMTPIYAQGSFKFYDKIDGNEDGAIDQSSTHLVFKILDSDGDGEIPRDEFERNLLKIWTGVAKETKDLVNK